MSNFRTWAVLVGIDRYKHLDRLKNSVADVELLKTVLLRDFGFQPRMVRTLTNSAATQKSLLRLINDTIPRRWDVKASDQLLFFFAGHAEVALRDRRRTWYLAPVDARVNARGVPDWETVVTGSEIRRLEETFAGSHILNIFDACYSGMQFKAEVPRKRKVRVKSAYAIVAGREKEPVLDEGGAGHSVFTESFVTALDGWAQMQVEDDGSFKASDLHTFIRRDVPRQIRKRGLKPIQRPYGSPLKPSEQGEEFTFRPTVRRLPPSTTQALLNDLVDVRQTAVSRLPSSAESGPDLVLSALQRIATNEESPIVRTAIATQLGRFETDSSLALLKTLIRDNDEQVAIAAARSLPIAAKRDASAAVRILNAVRPTASGRLLRTIDFSLAHLGEARSVRSILRDLPTEQGSIRREIIDVLRHLSSAAISRDELTELLRPYLNSEEWRKRRAASEAVGELGLVGAVGTLARLATQVKQHFMVRCAATEALGHIGGGPAGEAVRQILPTDPSLLVRTAAAESLGALGGVDALDFLITALRTDEEWRVRRAAAEACGFLQDTAAVEPLSNASDDSHFRVRLAVAWALGEIRSKDCLTTLNAMKMRDRSRLVRESAKRALEHLKNPSE